MSDSILNIKEAADYLKVHWQTVRSFINSGKLKATRVGKGIRIKESDVKVMAGITNAVEKHEIEVRYLIEHRKRLEEKLINLGWRISYHGHVIDHWYIPNEIRDLAHKTEWYDGGIGYGVRIREQDNGYTGNMVTSLEIKRLLVPFKHDTCIEHELSVSNFEDCERLLKLMNYKKMVSLDKDRVAYSWKNYKLVIDDIMNFKTGVEIETITDAERTVVLPKLDRIAKLLGLTRAQKVEKSVTFLYMNKFSKF